MRTWGASLPWVVGPQSLESLETFCREGHANYLTRKSLPLVLYRRDTGEFVGGSGLHCPDWSVPNFEIGYWCRTRLANRGYITEAVAAVTAFAFEALGARRVECWTDESNLASRRVCERTGFTLEGIPHHERLGVAGELRNTCLYAQIR